MSIDLTKLNNIEGVGDSFIYSKSGTLLIPQLQYEDARIAQLGRDIALSAALLEKIKQQVDFIELLYEDRRIIVRITHDYFILVMCENTVDFTLIKLTVNVINEGIKDSKDIQRLLQKSPEKKDLIAEVQNDSELKELLEKMRIVTKKEG
jgi:hypothetical protein